MTAHRERARGKRDAGGLSLIISAMMLTAILMIAYVEYQLTTVPVLEAEKEDSHMREVGRQLAALKAELDKQLQNRTVTPVANPVTLGRERTSALTDMTTWGSMTFEPDGHAARLWSKRFLMQEENRTSLAGHPESWLELAGATHTFGAVWDVLSLRVRLDAVSRDHAGDHAVVEVTDADGLPAGAFRVCVARHSPDWDLHYVVIDAVGEVLFNGADAYHNTQSYAPFWIDLLEPDFRFDRLLSTTKAPFELTILSENNVGATPECPGDGDTGSGGDDLAASYAITYMERTDEGIIVRGGGGLVREDFRRTFPGGAFTFRSNNARAEQQAFVLENGGLVMAQRDGAIFRVRPHFTAALVNNVVSLGITIPSLDGEPASVTGSGAGTVYTGATRQEWFSGQSTNVTLEVETAHPALWASMWRAELLRAGLAEGTHFTLATTASTARVDVWGVLAPAPGATEYDVFLVLREARIAIRLDS